jgi:putative transposase
MTPAPKPAGRLRRRLPRLEHIHYCGTAWVHWTMTVNPRRGGWLDQTVHLRCREILVHTLARHSLVCPCYCLMPDHLHLLWLGISSTADQRRAVSFFRQHTGPLLAGHGLAWQKQAYDHVLHEAERDPQEFETIAHYILENPVRACLVEHSSQYKFSGAVVPGYPVLDIHHHDFWQTFWRIWQKLVQQHLAAQPPPP